MSSTTAGGFPYPDPTDAVANTDLAIKALAEAADGHAVLLSNGGAAQSIPNNATTNMSLDTEQSDTAGQVGGLPVTGVTVTEAGLYLVGATGGVGNRTSSVCVTSITVNGTAVAASQIDSAVNTSLSVTTLVKLAAGDVVRATLFQNSGAAVNTFGIRRLWLVRVAPVG